MAKCPPIKKETFKSPGKPDHVQWLILKYKDSYPIRDILKMFGWNYHPLRRKWMTSDFSKVQALHNYYKADALHVNTPPREEKPPHWAGLND